MEYFYNNEAEYIALCNKVLIGLDDQIVELIKDNDWPAEFGYTSYQDTPHNIYDIWFKVSVIDPDDDITEHEARICLKVGREYFAKDSLKIIDTAGKFEHLKYSIKPEEYIRLRILYSIGHIISKVSSGKATVTWYRDMHTVFRCMTNGTFEWTQGRG